VGAKTHEYFSERIKVVRTNPARIVTDSTAATMRAARSPFNGTIATLQL
jgi:hypothetical protein